MPAPLKACPAADKPITVRNETRIAKVLLNDLPVCITNLDIAQIELLQLRLNLRAIADANQDHLFRVQIFFRHDFRIIRGHGGEPPGQLRVIIRRKIVQKYFREGPGGLTAGFNMPGSDRD